MKHLLLPILLLVASLDGRAALATPATPNIIIILVDDVGVMDTSAPFLTDAAGKPVRYPLNGFYRTPNMERLAARGIRFSNFCAMSVCSPTRISLMTGQNAARHHTTNWISSDESNTGSHGPPQWNSQGLKKSDVTLPRLLQANGYRTIHVGKGHFGPRGSEGAQPLNLGFDLNVGGAHDSAGSYYGIENFGNPVNGKPGKLRGRGVPGLEKYHGTGIFLTEALTLEANARIDDAVRDGQPFFLNFAHYAVHRPFQSDPRFAAHYRDSGKPPEAQAFAALTEGMDKSLGDILDHLDQLGIAENTLILFLGDNGSDAPLGDQNDVACAAPLRGKKGSHYEGGMRVPFIAAWARASANNVHQQRLPIPAGAIQGQLASVDDLFPTILALTGTAVPRGHTVDGARLDTLLTGQPDSTRRETFLMHYPHAHRSEYWTSYRDGDWKVIYHYFPTAVSGNSHYQLFNLARDPSESNNLAATEPDELRRLMGGLIATLAEQGALYPVADDHVTPVKPQMPPAAPSPQAAQRPNILLIVSDDQGYADAGFQGSPDISTPHLERLAAAGIRFTNGYVTHSFCSPSRAGLLTGRYQQRFGHEQNPFHDPTDHREGLPMTETLLPARLEPAGYVTGWVGKWHLGTAPEFAPHRRGFTETFGFASGGHRYRDWKVNAAVANTVPIERNGVAVEEPAHLTAAFGREAAAFVRRHRSEPWFLYLAFNAPHNPMEPTPERLARFASIKDPLRQKYAAQVSLMDDAIGETLAALRESGQEGRTLVFFFSDNGGPRASINGADNTPLRGAKGSVYEGGVRVPFLMAWPGRLAAGTSDDRPVSSLDVFATALGVAGVAMPTDRKYDSVNLIPFLAGEKTGVPHERLFWRDGTQLAVREDNWKLVREADQPDELYDLVQDIGEKKDLSRAQPAVTARLAAALDDWNKELIEPVFPGDAGRNVNGGKAARRKNQ